EKQDELLPDRPWRPAIPLPEPSKLELVLSGNYVGERIIDLVVPAVSKVNSHLVKLDLSSECIYTMIALRLYQMKHGDLPPTLDALVPEYIDAAPVDPYDLQPVRYDPTRAILYSVGENGNDEGGNSYLSIFDYAHPDYAEALEYRDIAEQDNDEPTYHIRFDLEPRTFERAE
ncbi:MAG: hypothetical protein ACQKBV_13915, partial [Puniceicoccales bacterium]